MPNVLPSILPLFRFSYQPVKVTSVHFPTHKHDHLYLSQACKQAVSLLGWTKTCVNCALYHLESVKMINYWSQTPPGVHRASLLLRPYLIIYIQLEKHNGKCQMEKARAMKRGENERITRTFSQR